MKTIIFQIFLISFLFSTSWSAVVNGKLSFLVNGDLVPVASGKVSIGVITDERDAFLSATVDVLSSKRVSSVDGDGEYEFHGLPVDVDLLVMAGRNGVREPIMIKRINLKPSEERVVGFIFPPAPDSLELSVKGDITIDGNVPSEVVTGSVTVVNENETIASLFMFGTMSNGEYRFYNLPSGSYNLIVGYEDGQGDVTVNTEVISVIGIQVLERDVNIVTESP